MSNLVEHNRFYDNGSLKREKENFQGFLFENIDLRNNKTSISFLRSDFRGVKVQNSHFLENNFSRADFIDSTILNSTFQDCIFKHTEIYNTYFENSMFSEGTINSAGLSRLIFENCSFTDIEFSANTFNNSKLNNCKLIDVQFKKNSIDDIEFENTSFKNSDFSNNTSINLFFANCLFDNVTIDADYLGSYFFKGSFLDNLNLKYRGKVFKLNISQTELIDNLFKILLEKERYYEAINILVLKNSLSETKHSIFNVVSIATNYLLEEKNKLKRTYQFDKIYKLLEYYINTGYIQIDDYFKIINHFDCINTSNFDFFEQIDFREKANRLKTIINEIDFSGIFIDSIYVNKKVFIEISIEEANQTTFEKLFDNIINKIGQDIDINGRVYEVINKRKGSIIYEIIIYCSAVILLLTMLKSIIRGLRGTVNEVMNLAIDYRINSKILEHTKKIKGKDSIEEIKSIKKLQGISDKVLAQKDLVNTDINKLLPLLKSLVVYPNTLTDRK